MKRKVKDWIEVQRPVEWKAILECGHTPNEYDEFDFSEEQKLNILRDGNEIECFRCQRLEDDITRKQLELRALIEKRK